MTPARVIGAGLSGLTAAWRLVEAGFLVEVIEAADRPGGLIDTMETRHGRVERAANAFVWNESVAALFQSLDIAPEFASTEARRRYIFRDGRPRRWPLGPGETVALALNATRALVTGRRSPVSRESVVEWSDRVWGPAATRWLISPALQGLYAVPADQLAAGAVVSSGGSIIRRSRGTTIAGPTGGMSALMNRLVERLRQHGATMAFGEHVESLDPSIPTVVATSSRAAASLVAPHAPGLAASLASLPMTTLGLATAFFPPDDRDLHGFGVLFPRGCGVEALGVRFDSDIFPADQPQKWRTETWITRLDPATADSLDSERLWQSVWTDRKTFTGRRDEPVAVVTSCQPEALPQYGSGVLEIRQRLGELPPWLALAGNYMGRLGASKLVDVAGEAATRVARLTHAKNRRSAVNDVS
jgi:oxygen-dependent protoporphyrinogen oxidase